jgi:hypothetical protein
MPIENTPIYDEVKKIIGGTEGVFFKWTCEFIAGSEIIVPFKLVSVDIVRNYNQDYSDDIQIKVMFTEGVFNKKIMPWLASLEIALKRSPIVVGEATANANQKAEVQRYRGIFLEEPTPYVKGATPDNIDTEGADLTGFKVVEFQLMDMVIEQLRGRSVGGIFKNAKAADVLRLLLGKESKKIDVPSEIAVKGVDMVEPSNTTVRETVIIPHGLPLIDLPDYLQVHCGGIYSAGMGFYLQRGMWYVFPEFDTTRFKKELKTLTVINVPPNKMPGVDHTYRTTGNQVIILSTGGFRHSDDSDNLQLNIGNGVRFTNADNVIDGYGKYENGKYSVDRTKNNSEFTAFDRPTGINKAMVSNVRITSNPFNEYSSLARRNCSHVMFVWENSNDSLIYPGMPCKLIYEDNDEVKETEGVVNQVHHYTTGRGSSMIDDRYQTQSTVIILIANPNAK